MRAAARRAMRMLQVRLDLSKPVDNIADALAKPVLFKKQSPSGIMELEMM